MERVERPSRDELHFRLKLTNKSDRPLFLAGINYESGPVPELVFIEQWWPEEGWKRTYCMDTEPPHVLKLNPGESIADDSVLKLPMSLLCRNPIRRLEGRFRFRVDYFDSDKELRTYLGDIFVRFKKDEELKARTTLSEPFEIPPYHDPN